MSHTADELSDMAMLRKDLERVKQQVCTMIVNIVTVPKTGQL